MLCSLPSSAISSSSGKALRYFLPSSVSSVYSLLCLSTLTASISASSSIALLTESSLMPKAFSSSKLAVFLLLRNSSTAAVYSCKQLHRVAITTLLIAVDNATYSNIERQYLYALQFCFSMAMLILPLCICTIGSVLLGLSVLQKSNSRNSCIHHRRIL